MWCLVMVLLVPVSGFDRLTVLQEYPTLTACQIDRNRVGFAMADAYPYERTFTIDCLLRPPRLNLLAAR